MTQHLTTNGHPETSEKFMLCLDVSPLIAREDEKNGQVRGKSDSMVLDCLAPLTKSKKKVLMHPIINTFVMIQYNSYTTLFMIILLLKLLHAILISGLTIIEMPSQNVTMMEEIDKNPVNKIGVWYISALVFTIILFIVEIIELATTEPIIIYYFKSFRNWVQSLHCIAIFVYQILILYMDVGALGAFVVFIAWLDLSVSLKSLMFSKWSNLGLYITMLIEVILNIKFLMQTKIVSLLIINF